jgi:hypothetical protein
MFGTSASSRISTFSSLAASFSSVAASRQTALGWRRGRCRSRGPGSGSCQKPSPLAPTMSASRLFQRLGHAYDRQIIRKPAQPSLVLAAAL